MSRLFKVCSLFSIILVLSIPLSIDAQISDIKKKSRENNNEKNNGTDNDDNGSDIIDGCLEGCFSGLFESCFDIGCSVMTAVFAEYTQYVYSFHDVDPSVLSLDINANFALGLHYSEVKAFNYVNYLPGLRANLASFGLDFRYNILTEYTDGNPDAFKSWHLLMLINLVPSEKMKFMIGSGVQREQYTNSYFIEHYLGAKVGLSQNRDYLDMDIRTSVDYETGEFPFFEGGVHYNKRIIDFEHLSAYISLGTIYQNYYSSHDIWALRGGLIFNWH